MLNKIRSYIHSQLFPCHKTLMALFEENAVSVRQNTLARERLQAACQQGQVCRVKARG